MKTALILNIVIIVLECIGLSISVSSRKWGIFIFYTQISNLITLISSVLFVTLGQIPFVAVMRYLSCSMLTLTFLVTALYLVPIGGGKGLLISGNGLYHHTLCPVISAVSYLLFEETVSDFRMILLPLAITFIYGVIMLVMNAKGKVEGPYPFFEVHRMPAMKIFMWMAGLLIVTAGIGYIYIIL